MLNQSVGSKQLQLHPTRLLLRFILAASILFIGFSIIAYLLLLNISNQNLDRYFNQLYAHNSRLINRIVDENLGTLRALAELEEYQDKLARDLQEYRNTTGLFKPLPPIPVSPPKQTGGESGTGFPGDMPMRIKFISLDGIIISSDEPQSRYSRFNFFKRITEQIEAGLTSGSIIIAAGENDSGSPNHGGIIYFYELVLHHEIGEIGYLVSEFKLDVLTGRKLYRDDFTDGDLDAGDTDLFGFFNSSEQYIIDAEGRPVTPLYKGLEYSEKLKTMGYNQDITDITLFNPVSEKNKENEFSNIPVINQLLTEKNGEFKRFKRKYRNYNNVVVDGGGFWNSDVGIGFITEVNSAAAFRVYWSTFGLIIFIITLCFAVSIHFILWINRLRVQALEANPLTQLPGNRVINKQIQSVLDKKKPVAIVYGDLDNFKAFNDAYGFSMGDRVIRFTADIIKKIMDSYPANESFCGHIGGDDFIFIVPDSEVDEAAHQIGRLFDSGVRGFYSKEHLEAGFIEEKNREGEMKRFPIMAFSMAGLKVASCDVSHYLEVANRCGELKKLSKQLPGSALVMERRCG